MAIKISRSRLFGFLRRVFHYQNGPRSDLGSNPFNSGTWIVTEFVVLAVQIVMIMYTLAISKEEKPVWPMRIWVSGYGLGCILSLMQLCWRYHLVCLSQNHGGEALNLNSVSDVEQQRSHDDSRYLQSMNKYRTYLELFFAIWFVMGNVWVFDSRFGSFRRSPKLHILCISLLAWNAISYSFPFILFVLLCCCVPLISTMLGYNMTMGSNDRGASDEQLSKLASWKYKEVGNDLEAGKTVQNKENPVSSKISLLRTTKITSQFSYSD
ncbi:OLC1v1022426C1 [Oldenlandia corymbosa var. corymbosa]|uniref:OLC1v1022426C1 n=1 Tax=Oldenlandia corymbosa var. corymbosa TaxID=529605 RepID=A0AAV1BZ54_OLDCO|nr:OLC1v1022426C1 [Oldenlandia corymbosa var. corymbosa]